MDIKEKAQVRQILTDYLEANNCRKTSERYAILDAVYSLRGHFSIGELNEHLLSKNFRVSRATLYNTLRLLISLQLVVKHVFPSGIKYETGFRNSAHCHQICTVCGKEEELKFPQIEPLINKLRLRRFRMEGFVLNIYGICKACQGKTAHNSQALLPDMNVKSSKIKINVQRKS